MKDHPFYESPLAKRLLERARAQSAEVRWLMPSLLAYGTVNLFYGPPKSMKSLALVSLMQARLAGGLWLGKTVPRGLGLYLYHPGETSAAQLGAYARIHAIDPESFGQYFLPVESWDEVLEVTLAASEALVVVDSLSRFLPDKEGIENDNSFVNNFLGKLRESAVKSATVVMLVHHASRMGNVRGAVAIESGVDVLFSVKNRRSSGGAEVSLRGGRLVKPGNVGLYRHPEARKTSETAVLITTHQQLALYVRKQGMPMPGPQGMLLAVPKATIKVNANTLRAWKKREYIQMLKVGGEEYIGLPKTMSETTDLMTAVTS